jgi:hypothetical protein
VHIAFATEAIRRGGAGIAAGPLLILSSGIELVHPVQNPDGHVLEPRLYLGLTAMWALGMLCVAATVLAVRRLHRQATAAWSRAGRVGVRFAVAGSLLQVLFALVSGITGILSSKPLAAAFLLFGLGFLCLIIGEILLGLAVLRAGILRAGARPIFLGAVSAFIAIAVVTDPWHDVAMFVFDATWIALGTLLLRHSLRSLTPMHGRQGEALPR